MTASRRRSVTVGAFAIGALALAGSAATFAIAIVNHRSITSLDGADPIAIVLPIGFALVGALVASRQPRNPVGWLFLFIALTSAFSGLGDQYARYALITAPGSLPGAAWGLLVYSSLNSLAYPAGAAALALLLLPSGRLPSKRWRPVVPVAIVMTLVYLVPAGVLLPGPLSPKGAGGNGHSVSNPLGVAALQPFSYQGSLGVVTFALSFAGLFVFVVAAAAPFVRMRRARGDERQQLKWIAYAVLMSAVVSSVIAGASFWSVPVLGSAWLNNLSIVVGFGIAFPVASGIAIFKYRLYDIDVIISRTLVYGALAALITGVYVGIAVGIGELVGSGGKPNIGLSILATAIVAVGFQPARERLQRVANRVVYGKRATPYQVLSEFSSHVAGSYAADEVLPRMARVLQEGTGAQSATVWLRGGDQLHAAATSPDSPGAGSTAAVAVNGELPMLSGVTRVEVRHQGELLGALSVVKRRGESLTPVEEKLLDDLAHQAGLVLRNVGLTADLQLRLEELRASRQRLVSAQDGERRRLERNLHDGAQQHLVALKVKLGLAQMLADRDPEKARQTLRQLKTHTDEALETLRDLARGIYPPLLADRGLPSALESQARKATIAVTVNSDGVGRYPQDVEATVYFCVLEALQNVQKYADATHVTVQVREDDGALAFEVIDDGRGFDAATVRRGAGLANMQDRLDALGGAVHIESVPGHGTRVSARIPLRQPAMAG